MQMAVQTDRSVGTLERQRAAFFQRKARAVSDIGTGAGGKYFRLITTPGPSDEEWIYMGPYTVGDPEFDAELFVAVVDADGNEITKEDETILDSTSTPVEMSFLYDADSEVQEIIHSGIPAIFASATAEGDYYARVTGLTGSASSLNGRLLKIVKKWSAGDVEVQALDADGNRVPITDANKTGTMTLECVQITAKKVKVSGFYKDSDLTTQLWGIQETKLASYGIQRVELNNRVVMSVGGFLTALNPTNVGDVVTISGHSETTPHSNNGTYRVSKVIDDYTAELVGEDWGPVYLNSKAAVSLGTITVKSDGKFYDNPYLKFDDPDIIPDGDFYVLYQRMGTIRQALQDDPAALLAPTKYLQEAAHNTTKAILGIVGPSVDNLTDAINWLYGDRRNNMEDLYDRINKEHYGHDSSEGAGRHSNIRPDVIDMFPDVLGTTVTIRSANNVSEDTALKMKLLDRSGTLVFSVDGQGHVAISDDSAVAGALDFYIVKSAESAQMYVETLGTYQARVATYAWGDMSAQIVSEGSTSRSWLYLANATSQWYLTADGNTVALKRSTTPYWTADGTRGDLLANVDLVPDIDDTRTLGTYAYLWKETHTSLLEVASGGGAYGVDSDLIPTTDENYWLGSSSLRWGQLHVSDYIFMEELSLSQSLPSLYIDKQYSHLPALAGNIESYARFLGSDSISNVRYGVSSEVQWIGTASTQALWHLAAFSAYYRHDATAVYNVSNGYGFRSRGTVSSSAGGKTVNFSHFYAENLTGATGLDKQYGLYVDNLTQGSVEKWAVYTAGTTPSYFGGQVNVNGFLYGASNAQVDGDLTVNGGDLTLTNGVDTLVDMGVSGSDGFISVKDDTSLVQLTGTDLYYAREWAQMEKTRHFAIWGLALENDWNATEQTTDLVKVQPGAWFANGDIYAITSEATGNAGATGKQMNGAAAPLFGWRFCFLHPTQGLWFGDYYPVNGRPNPDQSYAGLASQYRFPEQWIYVGAVFKDDSAGTPWVHRFVRRGDRVYMGYGNRGSYGNLDPESSTDIGTSGATSITVDFSAVNCLIPAYDTKWPETLVSGLIFEAHLLNGNAFASVDIFHGDGSGDRIRAAHLYKQSAAASDQPAYGPFEVSTKKNASSLSFDVEHRSTAGATTNFNMSLLGYVEPMLRAFDSRYIY